MNCDRFEKELENLGSWQILKDNGVFAQHRQECPSCQDKFDEYARLFAALKSDVPAMPDERYWASFPALVRERLEAKKARPVWKPVLAFGTPIAVMVLIAGIFLFNRGGSPDLRNLTAGDAFNYAEPADASNLDLGLSENSLASFFGEAEKEIVGRNNIEELVFLLTEEQFKKLEENLKGLKL